MFCNAMLSKVLFLLLKICCTIAVFVDKLQKFATLCCLLKKFSPKEFSRTGSVGESHVQ